jgi:preprotein translocase subunit SecG
MDEPKDQLLNSHMIIVIIIIIIIIIIIHEAEKNKSDIIGEGSRSHA